MSDDDHHHPDETPPAVVLARLEQRLGYTHKGVERLIAGAELDRAVRLAGGLGPWARG